MPPGAEYYICPVCNRKHRHDFMTFHHLLPSTNSEGKSEPTIYVCLTCHRVIHFCHTNKDLRNVYNTIVAIKSSTIINNMIDLYRYKADDCIFTIRKLKHKLKRRETNGLQRENRKHSN